MNQNTREESGLTKLVLGDRAPDVTLSDHAGQPTSLASLWQSRPRVLLFVRHFG